MVQSAIDRPATIEPAIGPDELVRAWRWMLQARIMDDKLASLYRGGKITGGVYLGRGQEAVSVALGVALRPGDVFSPLIRDLAGRLAFGETLLEGVRTYLGSALGPMRGRDGNIHRGRPKDGLLAMISHLGAMIPTVSGCLMAHRFQGIKGTVGATCLGDGGTSTGAFHEGLNQAAVEKLPLVVVVTNNQYAYSTPNTEQFACRSLVDRAVGYGITGHEVDGTSLTACLRVIGEAVNRARAGGGPQLVVAELLRLCGHGEHDDASYVDPRLRTAPVGRDCLKIGEEELLAAGAAAKADFAKWRAEAVQTTEEVVAQVQREPGPDPFKEDWCALATRRLAESISGE